LDGYRLQARLDGDKVKLLTRTGLDWTAKFGAEVVEALQNLPARQAVIDGELVVNGGAGATDFSLLQQDLSEGRSDRFVFFAFDLLYRDGNSLIDTPLIQRKLALERLLTGSSEKLRYSEHFDGEGGLVLKHA